MEDVEEDDDEVSEGEGLDGRGIGEGVGGEEGGGEGVGED